MQFDHAGSSEIVGAALLNGSIDGAAIEVGPNIQRVEAAGTLEALCKKTQPACRFDINKILDPSFVQDADKRGLGK